MAVELPGDKTRRRVPRKPKAGAQLAAGPSTERLTPPPIHMEIERQSLPTPDAGLAPLRHDVDPQEIISAPDLLTTPAEDEAMLDAQYGGPSQDFVPYVADEDLIESIPAQPQPDGMLPDDAPGDDRVDNALKSRFVDIERDQALQWLLGQGASIGAVTGAALSDDPKKAAQPALRITRLPTHDMHREPTRDVRN